MADAQLKLSRRTLLAAACAAPVLSAVEGPLLGLSEGDFLGAERAALRRDPSVTFGAAAPDPGTAAGLRADSAAEPGLRRTGGWRRALARLRRAEAAVLALEGGPDEAAFGRAQDRFNALFRRLLATPAPDIAALADKLEIAVAAELADLTYAPPALEALAADARRLSARPGAP